MAPLSNSTSQRGKSNKRKNANANNAAHQRRMILFLGVVVLELVLVLVQMCERNFKSMFLQQQLMVPVPVRKELPQHHHNNKTIVIAADTSLSSPTPVANNNSSNNIADTLELYPDDNSGSGRLRGSSEHEQDHPDNDNTVNTFRCSIESTTTNNSNKDKEIPMVNFFSSAVGEKYEDLLPMYAFYALTAHHKASVLNTIAGAGGSGSDAVVEIVVLNATVFIERHRSSLAWLINSFSTNHDTHNNSDPHSIVSAAAVDGPGSVCVRDYTSDHSKRTTTTNTWRYIEVPIRPAKYTYIGDVDLFLTESPLVDPLRHEQMKVFGIPYSNIVRDYTKVPQRLTGLMLVETERFYTRSLIKAQATINATGNDEAFLYNIVEKAGLGLPSCPLDSLNNCTRLLTYRPMHGIHLSFNRGPHKRMCHTCWDQFKTILPTTIYSLYSYLQSDPYATQFLSTVTEDIVLQEQENMITIQNKCQSSDNMLNHTDTMKEVQKLQYCRRKASRGRVVAQ